jgi:hypothetical protein
MQREILDCGEEVVDLEVDGMREDWDVGAG